MGDYIEDSKEAFKAEAKLRVENDHMTDFDIQYSDYNASQETFWGRKKKHFMISLKSTGRFVKLFRTVCLTQQTNKKQAETQTIPGIC